MWLIPDNDDYDNVANAFWIFIYILMLRHYKKKDTAMGRDISYHNNATLCENRLEECSSVAQSIFYGFSGIWSTNRSGVLFSQVCTLIENLTKVKRSCEWESIFWLKRRKWSVLLLPFTSKTFRHFATKVQKQFQKFCFYPTMITFWDNHLIAEAGGSSHLIFLITIENWTENAPIFFWIFRAFDTTWYQPFVLR